MKNLIKVEIVKLGSAIITISLSAGSKSSELREKLKLSEKVSLFRNSKKLSLTSQIKDGDRIFLAMSAKSAIDVKCGGVKWRIHKNDADHQPSDFHAHDYENNQVANLYTGKIYRKNKEIGKLKKSDWNQILHQLSVCKEANLKGKAVKVLNETLHSNE